MATACSFDDEALAIVIDNGSAEIKAGFAGEDAPQCILRNIIGRPRRLDSTLPHTDQRDCYIGDNALSFKDILSITYPVEHGIITNWDDMEKIWHYLFSKELRISSKEYPVLITESSFNPIGHREKTAQILFEHFQVPTMYIGNQARLSVYSSGRSTSIALEMGDGVIQTMPIYQGYTVPHSIQRVNFGGRDLTNWMAQLLTERGYSFATTFEREIVRDMKEKHAYVALDFEQELHSKKIEQKYKLPDGQELTIGTERFRCGEALFNPALVGSQEPGAAQIVYDTLMKLDVDIRKDVLYNIVLNGGTSFIPGLVERMQKELRKLLSSTTFLRIITSPERKYSAWIGGSILASLSTFQRMWIAKSEYEEAGPSIVHRKCIE